MINCPKCNSEIDNDSFYCDQCGQQIFYCSLCGRPGKGHRCTSCGGVMISGEEKMNCSIHSTTRKSSDGEHTTQMDANNPNSVPEIYFSNENMHIRFAGAEGAIIGRRHGVYQKYFSEFAYVSGTHAQLNYRKGEGWMVTDLGSSNGTQVDGRQLRRGEPCPLLNGSKVQFANVEFNVEIQ